MRKAMYLIRTLCGAVKFKGAHFWNFKLSAIKGSNNIIIVGKNSKLNNPEIIITGNSNKLTIGNNVVLGPGCKIIMQWNNCKINIGDDSTCTRLVEFNVQEDYMEINVGKDCMFSNRIIIRTSDSHLMYDTKTNQRINCPAPVIIGNHVWIAPNTKIMKGSIIGNGAIIGSDTTVTKHIPDNTLCVGRPCKIVKENVSWSRENLF